VIVDANKSSHEFIRAFSEPVGSSGYKEAIEWSVIHPNGPHTDVITLYEEIRYFKKPPMPAAMWISSSNLRGAFPVTG
jgi:hypothetical protein